MKKIRSFILISLSGFSIHAQTCGGSALLSQDFANGIPGNWNILNLDGLTLASSTISYGFTGQWQSYDHLGQKCAVNCSNFTTAGNANDYLISPAITIPIGTTCLSWKASADSPYNPEDYQVRISTTSPTQAGMQANAPLLIVTGELPNWTEHSIDLSSFAGQTVYIGFWCTAAGWALYLDDIRVSTPVTRDVAVTSLALGEVALPGSYILSGNLLNEGTSAISSMNLNWNVNNGPANSMSLSSLNILPATYYNYSHNISWNPSSNGTNTIKIWASNINGSTDQFLSNDTLTQLAFINSFPRKPLIEEFTQASCWPCGMMNPAFDSLLYPNLHSAKITSIKYHTSWPGYDPMHDDNPQLSLDRVMYYDIPGVPMGLVDGVLIRDDCSSYPGSPACLTQSEIDSVAAIPSIFDIHVVNTPAGNNTNVSVTVTAKTIIPITSFRLYTVIIEDSINYGYPPGSNGEEDFYQVARVMLPDSGQALPTMTNNQTLTFNYSYPVLGIYAPSQLKTVAMIEDNNSHKVYQSTVESPYSNPNGIAENSGNYSLDIFPNPSHHLIFISANGISGKEISWSLTNLLGEIVFSGKEELVNSQFNKQLDLSALPDGIYLFQMNDGNGILSRKIEKNNN